MQPTRKRHMRGMLGLITGPAGAEQQEVGPGRCQQMLVGPKTFEARC